VSDRHGQEKGCKCDFDSVQQEKVDLRLRVVTVPEVEEEA